VNTTGRWPDPITLKHGWAKAVARPWNDDVADAHLRLIRGSSAFIERCVEALGELGVSGVTSPPLLPDNRAIWERAGFGEHLGLLLFRRPLTGSIEPAEDPVVVLSNPPWARMVEIDALAFMPLWRMNRAGLEEAHQATGTATVLGTFDGENLTGFAIVGVAGTTAYLQRIAVDPAQQGKGLGRSMVRAAIGWAMGRGATVMLLNTQPENQTSATLYETEGFRTTSPGLVVLRKET